MRQSKFRWGQRVRLLQNWPEDGFQVIKKKGSIETIIEFSPETTSYATRNVAWIPESFLTAAKEDAMKLSKRDLSSIKKCLVDAEYQVDQLGLGFLRLADASRLDTIQLMLTKISTRLEEAKHGRR